MVHHARGRHRSEKDSWNSLRLFQIYRFAFTLVLLLIFSLYNEGANLGSRNGSLFVAACLLSLAANSLLIHFAFDRRFPFRQQVFMTLTVDVILLTVLIQASGGLSSGLGMILVISVAGCSLLLPGRKALFFAAVATLCLFAEEIFSWLYQFQDSADFDLVAVHGAVLFTIAFLAAHLARRASTSEALANQQAEDIAGLAALNEHIVDKLDAGILVVGFDARIRLMNEAALQQLQCEAPSSRTELEQVSAELSTVWRQWAAAPKNKTYTLEGSPNGHELECRFIHIGSGHQRATLVQIDDVSQQRQQMQEIKLASLGRLTASIAHEIRNPLGSISHASQLLAESEQLDPSDKRLLDIVNNNAQRMNILIEDILNLSRRPSTHRVEVNLADWLRELVDEYLEQQTESVEIELQLQDQQASVDTNQLHQILWNLIANACKYASPINEKLKLIIRLAKSEQGAPHIDVIDNGEPLADTTRQHLFEPFFTTSPDGTGLGLYISRELCQSHGGALSFLSTEGGNCFRVQLPMGNK